MPNPAVDPPAVMATSFQGVQQTAQNRFLTTAPAAAPRVGVPFSCAPRVAPRQSSQTCPPQSGWIRFCLIKITVSSSPPLQEEEEEGLKPCIIWHSWILALGTGLGCSNQGTSRRPLASAGAGGEQPPAQLQQEEGFHGITRWLMLEGASGGHLVHASAPAGALGLCPGRFLIPARMESTQPPWGTCASAPSAVKKVFS